MKAQWSGSTALLLLALGAGAIATAALAAPVASHNVTVELADAARAPSASLYISFANPLAGRSFGYADDQGSVSGHLAVAPPPALTLNTADQISLADIAVSREFAPGVALEFGTGNTALANPYALRASRTNDGLFISDSALSSPYASLANGGTYGGMRVSLGRNFDLRFGAASRAGLSLDPGTPLSPIPRDLFVAAGNRYSAQSATASFEWRPTDWAGIALTATGTNERGTVLGRMTGPIAVASGAGTASFGISARVGFGDGWVATVAADRGVTRLDLKPSMLAPDASAPPESLETTSLGLAVTKQDIFGNDVLGFSLSRPVVQSNGVVFGDSGFGPRTRLPLASLTNGGAAETDMQLGYVTTFLDGSLAVSANAGYQMNANGQQGSDGVSATARAKIRF